MQNLSLITPTGDRFESLMLTFKYIMNQTFCRNGGLVEWLVVDDGETDSCSRVISAHPDSLLANLGITVHHIRLKHRPDLIGPRSLCRNISAALRFVTSRKVLIIEDDDCYLPHHLQDLHNRLDSSWMAGTVWQKYYHLPSKSFRIYRNRGSAFCSTGFQAGLKLTLAEVCNHCYEHRSKGLDARFWRQVQEAGYKVDIFEPEIDQVIGMKGLPGRRGIGVGHRPKKYHSDPHMAVLRDWVGDDYLQAYLEMVI